MEPAMELRGAGEERPPGDTAPPLRILHCPALVGGHAQQLARAERDLGHRSWAVAFQGSPFGFASDEILWAADTPRWAKEWRRWRLLWRAVRRFDVIHFNFGMTLTPQRYFCGDGDGRFPWLARLRRLLVGMIEMKDLRWLKRAGKGVVVTFQGDDVRQGDFCRTQFEEVFRRELPADYYAPAADAHKRWRIAQFARFADRMYALNPDLLRLLPAQARFLPYGHIDLREWQYAPKPAVTETPLVVHAPTHRGVKGTRFVLEAVNRLRAEGVPFRFQLVENLSRAEARRLYEQADVVIDQLLLGWYGGLAVEAMALGRAVMCFVRPSDLALVPAAMRAELPLIRVTAENLPTVLREHLTVRRHQLAEIGRRGRAFVERWHDPHQIARTLVEDYRDILEVARGRQTPADAA